METPGSPESSALLTSFEQACKAQAQGALSSSEVVALSRAAREEGSAGISIGPGGFTVGEGESASAGVLPELAARLYSQGARKLSFGAGIDRAETEAFITVLCGAWDTECETLTRLWRRELQHVQVSEERAELPDHRGTLNPNTVLQADYTRWRQELVPGDHGVVVRIEPRDDDFRLVSLGRNALGWYADCAEPEASGQARGGEGLKAEIEAETGSVADYLTQIDALGGTERQAVFSLMVRSHLRMGIKGVVPQILHFIGAHPELGTDSVTQIFASIGGLDALAALVGSDLANFKEAMALLTDKDADFVADLLSRIDDEGLRAEVGEKVEGARVSEVQAHGLSIENGSATEAVEAVEALFADGSEAAIQVALSGCKSAHSSVRLAVVSGMVANFLPEMKNHMMRLFQDKDEAVRLATLAFVHESGDRAFLREVVSRCNDPSFTSRGAKEQMTLVRTLRPHLKLGNVNTLFCTIVEAKGWTKNAALQRIQREAIRTLAENPSAEGRAALERVAKRWLGDKALKEAASQALSQMGTGGTK